MPDVGISKFYKARRSSRHLADALLHQRDRYRATYGVKEQGIAKLYIEVLSLDRKTNGGADRLLKWKQPTKDSVSGDCVSCTYSD